MKRTFLFLLLAGAGAALLFPDACLAIPPNTNVRDTAANWALHVLEGRRYFEAAQSNAQLAEIAPDDAGAREVCGTIALQMGDFAQAVSDFRAARERAGADDALADYGLGLCEMARGDYNEADAALNEAQSAASEDRKPEIALAQAVLAAEEGDARGALRAAAALDTPGARELAALVAYHASPKEGLPLVERFLAQSGATPVVADPPGLRLLGGFGGNGPALEAAVTDPALRAMLARRLDLGAGGAVADARHALKGAVDLQPPAGLGLAAAQTAMVSVSVDGRLIGMVNANPYDFSWDTTQVSNGPHTLVWSATVNGRPASETQSVYVLNKEAASEVAIPLSGQLRARIWKLLVLHPSYKVAEYLMAQAEERAGEMERANEHYLVCAAIDPSYKDVGARVRALFVGKAPVRFPVPVGLKIAKTGTIAGENHAEGFWMGNPNKREIALTFDDGPNPCTEELVAALQSAHAPATFFVVGMMAAKAPDVILQMAADGDDVEDHSYSHPNLDEALPDHIREEVLRGAVIDRALSGRWPAFFRPPGGDVDPRVLNVVRACGMTGAFWTVDAFSAEQKGSPALVTKWVVSHARPGAIVLMHDGIPCTTAAIPAIVRDLRARGYKLVTLRQLAHDALE